MKRFITLLMMVLLAGFAMAQTPQKLSYQAVVRNSANQLVANQPVTVTVDITDAAGSTNYYSETHSVTTNPNGLISLMVGEGSPVSGKMSDVIWWDAAIKTTIDVTGTKIENTTLVTAVPYALHADSARTVNREVLNEQIHEITDEAIGNLTIRITRTNVRVDSIGKKLTDTLKYYVSAQALADTANSIRIWVIGTIHDSLEVIRSEYSNITDIINNLSDRVDEFNIHVCDSVAACLNTSSDLQDALNQFLSEHHFLTSDSTIIKNMQEDITNIQTDITNLQNRVDEFNINVCDSVAACIEGGNAAINNAITNVTKEYLEEHNYLTKDSTTTINNITEQYLETKNYLTKDSTTIINIQNDITNLENRVDEFNLNVCDSVAKCMSTNTEIQDAINNITNNYLSENNFLTKDSITIQNIENKLETIQEGAEANVQSDWNVTDATSDAYILNKPNIKDSVNSVLTENNYMTEGDVANYLTTNNFLTKDSSTITNIQNDITNLENRVNEFNINVCDSVAKCLTPGSDIADSITNIVNNYLTENEFLTKDSTTITNIQNDITNLENRVNEFNINVCDSVAKCLTPGSDIADSITNIVNNYLTENEFLTKDSTTITNIQNDITNLENRVNEFNINVCDSVAKCLTPGSDIADSITNIVNNYLTENEFLTKDSTTITNIQNDITNLQNRVDEFNINVCDSVAKCLTPGSDIADSITNIVNNYLTENEFLTKDSTTITNIQNDITNLENRVNEFNINVCDSVAACLSTNTDLQDVINNITNNYVQDQHFLTKDSTTITNMQTDITNLQNRVNEFNINVCDSVAACMTAAGGAIKDSITNIVNNYLTENEFLTKDSTTITNMQTDITNLQNRVEEFNINVCDSVAACMTTGDIKDSITKIVNNYLTANEFLTKDSTTITNMQTDITNLQNRVEEFNINVCDSVAACLSTNSDLKDTITKIINNNLETKNYLTKDSVTITNIQNDITNLEQRVDEFNLHVCDSVAACMTTGDIKDSITKIVNNYLTANEFLTKDSVTITNMQTAITNLEGAEANVQADWNVTDATSDAYIKNKPNIKDSVNQVLTTNNYMTEGDVANYLTTNKYINEQALIDSNYVTESYLTTNKYITEEALIDSNYVKTTDLPTEHSAKFSATAGQTAFTIASAPHANYLVKIYINGILIGDNNTGVVTVSGTTVTYVPAENENYALEAGDKILIYWFN